MALTFAGCDSAFAHEHDDSGRSDDEGEAVAANNSASSSHDLTAAGRAAYMYHHRDHPTTNDHRHPLVAMRRALHEVRAASKASIVFNAEAGPTECVDRCPVAHWPPSWATAQCPERLPAAGLGCRYAPFFNRMRWPPNREHCLPVYLNSGVFAGDTTSLTSMVRWVAENMGHQCVATDQGVYLSYWLSHRHTGLVTLDYCGLFALTMGNLERHYRRPHRATTAVGTTGRERNRGLDLLYFGRGVCLVHNNGGNHGRYNTSKSWLEAKLAWQQSLPLGSALSAAEVSRARAAVAVGLSSAELSHAPATA